MTSESYRTACQYCFRIFHSKKEAKACEARCSLERNIRKEMRHVKAGEHSRQQGLAIAYGKTRRAGFKVPTAKQRAARKAFAETYGGKRTAASGHAGIEYIPGVGYVRIKG